MTHLSPPVLLEPLCYHPGLEGHWLQQQCGGVAVGQRRALHSHRCPVPLWSLLVVAEALPDVCPRHRAGKRPRATTCRETGGGEGSAASGCMAAAGQGEGERVATSAVQQHQQQQQQQQ
ncbi:hypothetical protein E2C01_020945 [Portunus trituberculatus]|uniref:Uncharacterized protein n=1 Tax=Portunus trituberculatus TaxID=210409 RepID=A0A5B7E2W7_PORTR|nr:hypothetical protein [Portunus trituberculatus]